MMAMSKTYTNYFDRIAITIPDRFIDVKTGESYLVSLKIQEQIEYHEKNNTLMHLVFSALNSYLNSKGANGVSAEILNELSEIKKMIETGYIPIKKSHKENDLGIKDVDIREVEDVLEAFGG